MNIYETFDNLRYHCENEVVEFKKAENSFSFDDLGKYFSALSNEANLRDKDFGWLVFGVHDKTREILGTSYKNGMKSMTCHSIPPTATLSGTSTNWRLRASGC